VIGAEHSSPATREGEAEIRKLIEDWSKALESKDLDGITAHYTPETLLFDAIPPYKMVGVEAIRQAWQHCLPHFPESFRSEHRNVVIHVDGDLAFVHGLHRFVPEDPNHPCGMTWMRFTSCYRRLDGQWKAVHEHFSIPFNPMDNQAWLLTDPDELSVPDYSGGCASPTE
jgi:uncharacterized protein (TIGR02246 family)